MSYISTGSFIPTNTSKIIQFIKSVSYKKSLLVIIILIMPELEFITQMKNTNIVKYVEILNIFKILKTSCLILKENRKELWPCFVYIFKYGRKLQ